MSKDSLYVIVGEKEENEGTVSLENTEKAISERLAIEAFISLVKEEINSTLVQF